MSFDFLRQHYLRQPHEVSIETYAMCNAACTFCPYPTLDRKGVKMSDELIDQLIHQMSKWERRFYISPFKVNEPFLDVRLKDICERLEYEVPQAKLRLFTNGSALTDKNIHWVSKLKNVEHLWVSLNEYEAEPYKKLMGISFDKTIENMDRLHKKIIGRNFPHRVNVSRVVDSTHRDFEFKQFVFGRWSYFIPYLIKRDGWLGYVEPSYDAVPRMPCARWFELNIMATGVASLCCMDGTGEYAVGDATKTSLLDIYNQTHLLHRREIKTHRGGINPCERCTY